MRPRQPRVVQHPDPGRARAGQDAPEAAHGQGGAGAHAGRGIGESGLNEETVQSEEKSESISEVNKVLPWK